MMHGLYAVHLFCKGGSWGAGFCHPQVYYPKKMDSISYASSQLLKMVLVWVGGNSMSHLRETLWHFTLSCMQQYA